MTTMALGHPGQHRRLYGIAGVAMLGAVLLFLVGYLPKRIAQHKLDVAAIEAAQTPPRVKTAPAVVAAGSRTLELPGNLVAVQQALVYARATGYVARWRVDIGDRVRAGDVLAELDTPDLDQQLAQARATATQKEAAIEQAVANRQYAFTTASREDALVHEGLVSQQDDDQARAQVKVALANVDAAHADLAAARADVRRLEELVSFGHVTAPFDGRITERNIDVGTLVNAGSGNPMFRIEATDPMRVFVQVPQPFALSIRDGETAGVTIRQMPGRTFAGTVVRTAGTLDPALRTLKVEVDVPNPSGALLAGMYAQVSLVGALAHRVIRVPSSAVISDARGNHVAIVDDAGVVHLAAVQRGLDDGTTIDITGGLNGGERVIATPAADIADGQRVTPE